MGEVSHTRNLYVRSICLIYWFAFLSFYVQIPGLYGNNGILPARSQMLSLKNFSEKAFKKPTLLWLAPFLGLNTEYMLDVLSLVGIILSLAGFMAQKFCIAPVFGALYILYLSLYQVGQTFLWFQWDSLLLEVGFLTILVAPWKYEFNQKNKQPSSPTDNITFFLIKWLLFRFMFASGIVKLQSDCPTWWGLTALNVHFESQPLPTVVAWYMHHAPTWFLKLGTVFTHVVEQIMPFLFFFPLRSVRIVGFFLQVLLQVLLILTGNYNFFNFLTIILCFSLLDDQFLLNNKVKTSFSWKIFDIALNFLVHGFVLYLTMVYFSVHFKSKWTIDLETAFTKTDFDNFLKRAVPAGIYIGSVSLIGLSIQALYNSFKESNRKISTIIVTLLYIGAVFFFFGISLVPYSILHKSSNSTVTPSLRKIYLQLENFQIANSYGLFRRMTGIGGRPEVIIEGANDLKGPWLEYHFKYKPGDVNSSLPIVVPYQPRLDWQMWFAALGTYHQNPWILSMAYRILEGEKSVLRLLDVKRLPFSKPPKYIKASLYHYHYTPWNQRKLPTWWKRENVGEYFPIFSKDQTSLVEYLKTFKVIDAKESIDADNKLVLPWLKTVLDGLRNTLGSIDPVLLSWSVVSAYIIITVVSDYTTSNGSHKKKT